MKRMHTRLLWRIAIGWAALPLLSTSCVEIAQRAVINGLFDAATPLIDEQVEDCLADAWDQEAAP
jgi:hypothetical protein